MESAHSLTKKIAVISPKEDLTIRLHDILGRYNGFELVHAYTVDEYRALHNTDQPDLVVMALADERTMAAVRQKIDAPLLVATDYENKFPDLNTIAAVAKLRPEGMITVGDSSYNSLIESQILVALGVKKSYNSAALIQGESRTWIENSRVDFKRLDDLAKEVFAFLVGRERRVDDKGEGEAIPNEYGMAIWLRQEALWNAAKVSGTVVDGVAELDGREVRYEAVKGEEMYAISVSDSMGLLTPDRIWNKIQGAVEDLFRPNGRGIFLTLHHSDLLIYDIWPDRKTVVTGVSCHKRSKRVPRQNSLLINVHDKETA